MKRVLVRPTTKMTQQWAAVAFLKAFREMILCGAFKFEEAFVENLIAAIDLAIEALQKCYKGVING